MSKSPRRQRLIVEALESRLLFSATADIALFDDGNCDAAHLQESAQHVDLVEIYALTDDSLIPPDQTDATDTTDTTYLNDDTSSTDDTKVVVFVDTSVEDYQQLVDDIRAHNDESTLDIIFLDPTKNGIEQITEQLQLYTGLTAIHIISHGKNGSVDFANASLNQNTIQLYEDELTSWRSALSDDADILFYGCDVAATEAGQQLLAQIASLTQADIAASTNLTGHTSLQADWNLEFEIGSIETQEIISDDAQDSWVHVLTDVDYLRILSSNSTQSFTSASNVGQYFTMNAGDVSGQPSYVVNQITVQLKKDADAATQTITVQLRDSWNGTIRASDTISSDSLTTGFLWYNFDFADNTLTTGVEYVVQITTTGGDGKVATAYNNSNVWNNTEMVINGARDANKDLAIYITDEDGVNAAPTVANAIPDQNATENSAFNFQFASNAFNDADLGQNLTYTATLSSNAALPAWLSFDSATRTFSGTPDNGDVGVIAVKVTADDGNGGTVSDTFNITIAKINDAPSGTDDTITVTEDGSHTFTAADFGFDDSVDDPDADVLAAVKITTTPGNGSLTLNGVAVTAGDTVSVANINSGLLVFTPAANANGTSYTSFTFQVQDDGGTANGGVDLDPTPNTITFDVTSVNDAPSGTNATLTVVEDGSHTFTAANFGFSDANDSPADAFTAVKITTIPANGSLTLNGVAVTAGDTVAIADINSGLLVFTPVANANGTSYTSFTFQVQDDGGTASGGVDLDQSANTITFDVTSVNDAPSGTNATLTMVEDGSHTFTAANFGFSDANDSPADAFTAVKITTTPANGSLTLNGVAVTAGDTVAIADINSGLLVFTPVANANGTSYTSFTFQVQDDGGTASGGVDLDQSANTITFDVTSVNDAPNGTNATLTVVEDGSHTFTAANFGFSDANDSPADAFTAVKITTTPANGSLTLNGVAVTAGDTVAIADINSGLLVFTPVANANGTSYTSFTFQVQDDGGTASGGVDLDQSANTITFDVTSINDAPSGTNATLTVVEDGSHTFTAANFGFSDANDSPADAFTAVKITTTPANGSLTLNGVAVTAGDTVAIADINGGLLVFTPAANANGTSYTSFTFQVQDDGGTASGGVDLDQSANTITFDVTSVNDAPSGTNATLTVVEDGSHTFTAANFGFSDTNDSPADAFTAVKITTTPANGSLTLNGVAVTAGDTVAIADINSGLLVFTPVANANGASYTSFTFQVQDDGGTASGGVDLDQSANTITFDVTSVNDAPTVANAIANQSATEDTAFNFQFASNTFNDVDVGDTLSYSAQLSGGGALPAWLSFDANTRTFSGTPTNADVGTITIDVTADDGNGGTVTDTFDIVITNTNDAPTVANAIANQSATEDTAFNFQFASNTFNDVDVGDTLTYTAQLSGGGALPAWLSFDANTRTFSGTPTNADVGTITIDVTADDGNGGTVTDTFDIVIANTNDAPTVANAIANQSATEDTAFNFQFATNTFNDVDVGDTLTYTAQLSGGGALPAWLSFDANTRTFSGTPTNADVGTITIDVTADDGNGGTVTDAFDIVIANTNDAPTVANAIANQSATEDTAFNFQFASNTFNDVDVGDTLTYTAQLSGGGALPAWLSFDANTRTFSGTPTNADVGTVTIDITADDGNGGTVTDTFDIVIANANDAPTVANAIANQSATEDTAFNFQFASNTFNDVDVGDTLSYSAQLSGGGALPAWLSFDANTRTFSGTPTNADVGTITLDVTADDGNGGTVTDTFDIMITNTNDAPTVANAIANQSATEDTAFNFQFASNTFNDVDVGDTLTYTAQLSGGGALPAWLSFDANTRTFSGTPTNADVGTITIDLTADDGNGGTVTDTFDIVIANANDAPTVANAIANQSATEDTAFNFQFASNTFNDVDVGDTLTYTALLSGGGALPAWLSFDANTRTFSGTPTNADVGTITIDVTADDGNGGTVTDTFDIVIANTNDAPTLANALQDQTATEDTPFSFQFPANTFNDIDVTDTLTYTAQLTGGGALPAWLSFDSNTRTFSGTPLNANVGTLSIDVIANDGNGGVVSDTFSLVILNANDAPVVANPILDQTATEDAPFNFQFASNTFNDVDVGDTLTYTAQLSGGGALPAWLTFDPNTRTFSGTPTNNEVGVITINVIATDSNNASVTDTFALTVINTNDAPTLANPIGTQTAVEDATFNFQFASNTFNDVDVGDTLTYSVQLVGGGSLPTWLSFDSNTRTFSGTPTNADVGTLNIEVIANDGNGGIISDAFDIVIVNTNDAPTLTTAISNKTTVENSNFNFTFGANTFNDIDVGDTLSYSAQLANGNTLPAWLSFDPATRTFSGTPTNADIGTLSIRITADDGNGGTASTTFNLVVQVSNIPGDIVVVIPPEVTPPDLGDGSDPTIPTIDTPSTDIDDDTPSTPIVTDNSTLDNAGSPINPFIDSEDYADVDKNNRARLMQIEQESANTKEILGLSTSPLLASLISPDSGFTSDELASFDDALRKMRKEMDETVTEEAQQKAIITGVTISITTGVLIWSLRASSLLLTLFSMLPLWRGIDPLPILDEVNKRKKELEQQRKDKQKEDKNAKEVGYLFDNTTTQSSRKPQQ